MRERLARAEEKCEAVQMEVQRALDRLDEAKRHADSVREEVADIEADIASAPLQHSQPDQLPTLALTEAAESLLVALENAAWRSEAGQRGMPPEATLERMNILRDAVAAARPSPQRPTVDTALEEDFSPMATPRSGRGEPAAVRRMDLEDATAMAPRDGEDDATFGARVRGALQTQQRASPY